MTTNNLNNTPKNSKFRTNYDIDFKHIVVKYAIQTSNKAASDHFSINESNVRRWKRLVSKGELVENPLARRTNKTKSISKRTRGTGKSRRKRKRRPIPDGDVKEHEDSNDIDSMPLQQRLTSIATNSTSQEDNQTQTLKSQPLSPTKLKVTRHSTSKPSQSEKAPPYGVPVNEEVCLRWNSHHSNMQTVFPSLLSKEQYCDVTLVADGKSLKCHKLILSSCSSYFDHILEKIMPYQHPVIFMKDIPFNILKSLCDFMYVGEVNIRQCDLDQLLAVAESLKVKGLATKSESDTTDNIPMVEETVEPPSIKVKEPTLPKPSKAPSKTSFSEKKNSKSKEITDPLDLMEPTYEEAATPDLPPPTLKRNDSTRKSTGKRVRKRKHVGGDDHEPSPPVFRTRKGTRSRPNVKVPRYFNASFDNSNERPPPSLETSSEAPPTEGVAPPEDTSPSLDDPLMDLLDEIKTEPVDIEDGQISYGEESYEMEQEEEETPGFDGEEEQSNREIVQHEARSIRVNAKFGVAKQEKEDVGDPLNVENKEAGNNNGEELSNLVADEPHELLIDSRLTDVGIPLEIAPNENITYEIVQNEENGQMTLSIAETFSEVEIIPESSAT